MQPLAIGICSWSLDRSDPAAAIASARRDLGIGVVQVGFVDEVSLEDADAAGLGSAASEAGVEISATFVGFDGVDRSSVASVARTGGLVPDDVFEQRIATLQRGAALTQALNVGMLVTHLGAVPQDTSAKAYAVLVERVRRAAEVVGSHGVTLLAETGQESAEGLRDFLNTVGAANVGVNFDPANMVIYGSGDPVRAVTTLFDRIMHVHLKDGMPSANPGAAFGQETALGAGEANVPRVISKLRARGFQGPLVIERRIRDVKAIRKDLEYVRSMLF